MGTPRLVKAVCSAADAVCSAAAGVRLLTRCAPLLLACSTAAADVMCGRRCCGRAATGALWCAAPPGLWSPLLRASCGGRAVDELHPPGYGYRCGAASCGGRAVDELQSCESS